MSTLSGFRTVARLGATAAAAGTAGWAGYAALTWSRYGRTRPDLGTLALLDSVMPVAEVDECHQVVVHAPADVTLAAACGLDLQSSPVNAAIIALRTLPARLRGEAVRVEASEGLLAETLAMGWGRLAEDPGREIVMGALSQPWNGRATFTPLPPEAFTAFADPGYAKIVWTLSVEPIDAETSVFRTRTRVMTTDPGSRRLFRRYWAIFSPGILIIRYEALRLVKVAAERAARTAAASPVPASVLAPLDEPAPASDATRDDEAIAASRAGRPRRAGPHPRPHRGLTADPGSAGPASPRPGGRASNAITASHHAAAPSSRSRPFGAPDSWRANGRPSALSPIGMAIDGAPAKLHGAHSAKSPVPSARGGAAPGATGESSASSPPSTGRTASRQATPHPLRVREHGCRPCQPAPDEPADLRGIVGGVPLEPQLVDGRGLGLQHDHAASSISDSPAGSSTSTISAPALARSPIVASRWSRSSGPARSSSAALRPRRGRGTARAQRPAEHHRLQQRRVADGAGERPRVVERPRQRHDAIERDRPVRRP